MAKCTRPRAAPVLPGTGSITVQKSIADMSADELRAWLEGLKCRLEAKRRRERAYLDRRAAHGRHTPTDDAYEEDQGLEAELLALLDEMLRNLPQLSL
jgi:hypothetical protein